MSPHTRPSNESKNRWRKLDAEKSAIKAAASEIMTIISGEENEGPLSTKWTKEIVGKRTKLLAELPGIRQVTAEKIMAEAKDIMGLCSLSEEQLTKFEGVSSLYKQRNCRDFFTVNQDPISIARVFSWSKTSGNGPKQML